MTAHKHFKQLVRDRMEKTGESYSSARRQVIRAVPTPSRLLRPGHLPGNVPATTALRILLAHAGVRDPRTGEPFSEAMIFVIAGGIGIGVFQFYYAKEDHASFFIAGRHRWQDDFDYLEKAAARFGLVPVVKEASSAKAADRNLRELLDVGPCAVWIDLAMLPHRGMPTQYQGGGYHVVTAYRIDGGDVLFGDLTDEPLRLPLAEFNAARARIKKFKNRLLALPTASRTPDVADLVRGGLADCRRELGRSSAKSMKGNFQLDVLRTWAERLHGGKDKDSWERVFKPGANLWRGLTSIYDFVEHYGTGGGLCRPLFAEGLAGMDDDRLQALSERYQKIGRGLSGLANQALPTGVPAMREAKKLRRERGELMMSGAAVADVRAMWDKIEEQQRAAGECFPVSEPHCEKLRAELKARVLALHADEVAACNALEG